MTNTIHKTFEEEFPEIENLSSQAFQFLHQIIFNSTGASNRYKKNVKNFKGYSCNDTNFEFNRIYHFMKNINLMSADIKEVLNLIKISPSLNNNISFDIAKFIICFNKSQSFGFSSEMRQLETQYLQQNLRRPASVSMQENSQQHLLITQNDRRSKTMSCNKTTSITSSRLQQMKNDFEAAKRIAELDKANLELQRQQNEIEKNLISRRQQIENEENEIRESHQGSIMYEQSILPNEKCQNWIQHNNFSCESLKSASFKSTRYRENTLVASEPIQNHSNLIEKLLTRQVLGHDLPKFSGKIADWPSFYSIYKRTTQEGQFTEIENMQRLRKCLEGPARNCVEMILLTNDAEKVIKILQKNYGNKQTITKQIIDKAKNISAVTNNKTFLQYSNEVENLTYTMKNIIVELLSKLPEYMKFQWALFKRQKGFNKHNLQHYTQWVADQTDTILESEIGDCKEATDIAKEIVAEINNDAHETKRKSDYVKPINEKICGLCRSNDHNLTKCPEFTQADVQKR